MSRKKTPEVERQEAVSVHDDERRERGLGPYEGDWYTLVTTGPIYFGCLVACTPTDYHLRDASWVVETGRRSEYARDPQTAPEREFVGHVIVPRGSVNGVEWHAGYSGGALETK